MMRFCIIVGIGTISLLSGCSRPEPEAPAPATEGSAEAVVAPPADDSLRPASEQIFSMPVPASVELEEARTSLRHLRIRAPYDEILDFYRRELPDANVTRYERGAKVEMADGRSIYIYRELGERDYLLTYFDGTQQPGAGEAAAVPSANPERSVLDQGFGAPTSSDPSGTAAAEPAPEAAPGGDAAASDPWAVEPALPGRDEPPPLGFRVIDRPMHPRVRAAQPTEPRPIDFVRGVHEPRRNPDAQF